MKTPMEIASEIFDAAFTTIESDRFDDGRSDVEERSADYIREQIRLAVEADRAQRATDIATLAAAAANYAEHILDNIESMRADDEDRVTDQAERDEIMAAINRLAGTKEA